MGQWPEDSGLRKHLLSKMGAIEVHLSAGERLIQETEDVQSASLSRRLVMEATFWAGTWKVTLPKRQFTELPVHYKLLSVKHLQA